MLYYVKIVKENPKSQLILIYSNDTDHEVISVLNRVYEILALIPEKRLLSFTEENKKYLVHSQFTVNIVQKVAEVLPDNLQLPPASAIFPTLSVYS